MPKWVKMVIGIMLLPVCVATVKALWLILTSAGVRAADTLYLPLIAGAASWLAIFLLLPKPMWIYVVGHELTHAVWTWSFGGKVKRFKATSDGGHVVTTKSNFLITLAPYFFPLYAVLVVLTFMIGAFIWNWGAYRPWFHLFLGAAYAFHITLTWHILKTRQADITSQGYVFSSAVIFLGNAAVLLIAVPLLTGQDVLQAVGLWFHCNHQMFHRLTRVL
jgi:hypothetical protein